MLDRLILRWQQLQSRERRIVAAAAVFLALAFVYFVAWEPAANGRRQLARELPQLRQQVAQMDALAGEARRLASVASATLAPAQLRELIEQSVAAAGLQPNLAELKVSGELVDVRFNGVPFAPWLAWFEAAQREIRMRPVDVVVSREGAPGIVNARIALEPPKAAR